MGRFCGIKNGFVQVAQAPRNGKELGLAVVVQSPGYKWSVRISQVGCKDV